MRKNIIFTLVVLCVAVAMSYGYNQVVGKESTSKAIVVVSFGTTYAEARQANIEAVENTIKKSFPEYSVRRAFTSKQIIKVLAERDGIFIDNLEQALDKLKQEGYREVIIQPTHLTPGEEYEKKIIAVANERKKDFAKLLVGRPVMYFDGSKGYPDDYMMLLRALHAQLPKSKSYDAVVFMGHGSPNQSNPAYGALQQRYTQAGIPVFIGVVEETDHPNFEDVAARLKESNAKRVLLMPLMLVAGDHAVNDMAGEDDDSWKNKLAKLGYQVDVNVQGLGANPDFQNIYIQHIRDAISGIN